MRNEVSTAGPVGGFHPIVRAWFFDRFPAPTPLQERCWEATGRGEHILLTAPTGSGKTLAAFLRVLDDLISGRLSTGTTRILYISPLKALNSDIRENLLTPLEEIRTRFEAAGEPFPAIRVMTRSGDTPSAERQKMLRRPPEILITTPESLNLLLSSAKALRSLSGIRAVILDEIHAVAGNKRGTHLVTALERLVEAAGEFQRIAVSATVTPLERIAAFAAGYREGSDDPRPRPVTILRDTSPRVLHLDVRMPDPGEPGPEASVFPDLTAKLKAIIKAHRSTLVFTNSRRLAEKLTRFLNEDEPDILAWAHHGSLSKEIRRAVEQRLRTGELKAIVATSSLELGIDIGALDRVVLVQAPPDTASALQRLGRSNHCVGGASRGTLFPLHGMDLLQSAVTAEETVKRNLEPIRPVNAPLDLLAQILISMGIPGEWSVERAFSVLRRSWSYRSLKRSDFDRVVEMLAGRYADTPLPELKPRIYLDRIAGTFRSRPGARFVLYSSGGTIPDRGYYTLRDGAGNRLGELDEEFVWERRVGDRFTLGSRIWRIAAIGHSEVTVSADQAGGGMVPFWKADAMERGTRLSEAMGRFLEETDTAHPEAARRLLERFSFDEYTAERLLEFLRRQEETTGALPHRHRVVIETFRDPADTGGNRQVILHTLWGSRLNRPLALALAALWEEKTGTPLTTWTNNDSILLILPGNGDPEDLLRAVEPSRIVSRIRPALEKSGFFAALFRENAGRALLLPKRDFRSRQPLWLNRLRAVRLLAAVSPYGDFPVIQETWRECLQDRFDTEALAVRLQELQEGEIDVHHAFTDNPSPFTGDLIWRQTNHFMYREDEPLDSGVSRLGSDLLAAVAADSRLRPRIPGEAVRILAGRLLRSAPGYAPQDPDDLTAFLTERLLLEEGEWKTLFGISQENGLDPDTLPRERLIRFTPPGGRPHYAALENWPLLHASLRLPDDLPTDDVGSGALLTAERLGELTSGIPFPEDSGPERLLCRYLEGRPLLTPEELAERLGTDPAVVLDALLSAREEGRVVFDTITTDAAAPELCNRENLEALLRITRRLRKPDLRPLPAERLPRFLADWQGLTSPQDNTPQASIDRLLGYPAPARLWEEAFLPLRLPAYRSRILDELAADSDLGWRGCGKERTTLLFPEESGLYFPDPADPELQREAEVLFPSRRGRFRLFDLQGDTAILTETLWRLTWAGVTGNDSPETLRRGIRSRFKSSPTSGKRPGRSAFTRWKGERALTGNWFLWPEPEPPADAFERDMCDRERVRQLLARYGILNRELLDREMPALSWGRLFRTLRLMELSGEVSGGLFFEGLAAPQFAAREALRLLREDADPETVFFMNALDPASPAGIAPALPEGISVRRVPTTWLVFRGTTLIAVVERNGASLLLPVPEASAITACRELFAFLLSRDANPLREIRLETVNGEKAAGGPLEAALLDAGFMIRGGTPELRRQY